MAADDDRHAVARRSWTLRFRVEELPTASRTVTISLLSVSPVSGTEGTVKVYALPARAEMVTAEPLVTLYTEARLRLPPVSVATPPTETAAAVVV